MFLWARPSVYNASDPRRTRQNLIYRAMIIDIPAVRAELDEIRDESLTFFTEVEQLYGGQNNPNSPNLWALLPSDEKYRANVLRRRTAASARCIEIIVKDSSSLLVAEADLMTLARGIREIRAALRFQRHQADLEGAFLTVAESREILLDGCQEIKILLDLVSGTSKHSGGALDSSLHGSLQPFGSVSSWAEVEIRYLSEERIEIRVGGDLQTRNYSEFGFEDHRNGRPNLAWVTLRILAELGGSIQQPPSGPACAIVEKRMQEIRKVFRLFFGLSTPDPIPLVNGVGYKAAFKITCAPSFHT